MFLNRKGFTLIELSIVLVIIGLIVGGVLVGRDLIAAAQIRAQMTQFEKIDTAVRTFYGKYNGLPGDLTAAQGNQFGFSQVDGGNGDGILQDAYADAPLYAVWEEPYFFFIQLAQAHLIEGNYQLVGNHFVIGEQFPLAKVGKGGTIAFSWPDGRLAYFFGMSTSSTSNAYNISALSAAGIITPLQAFEIDSKLDDGNPVSGRVRSATVDGGGFIAYDTADDSCATGSSTKLYNVTDPVSDCRLIVNAQ